MNIPARYCTGDLGDIGIPAVPLPMDVAVWFEAHLGERWHHVDARNNTPRIAAGCRWRAGATRATWR
jgi:transglutaminase-like putative cysteine protease